jgi:hypothetical protein
MTRTAWLVCLGLSLATPLRAQTRVYLAGDFFADVTRLSRTLTPISLPEFGQGPPDSATMGGGGRLGAFFAPAWSLELGIDTARSHSHTEQIPIVLQAAPSISIGRPSFEGRSSVRYTTASVLVGYHPGAGHRVQPGFRRGSTIAKSRRLARL